ncbi:MAG: stage III sporulation protein AB [Clostridia bacterium]|nr:stage III sporulation protein AB [Clostridia bacterium]
MKAVLSLMIILLSFVYGNEKAVYPQKRAKALRELQEAFRQIEQKTRTTGLEIPVILKELAEEMPKRGRDLFTNLAADMKTGSPDWEARLNSTWEALKHGDIALAAYTGQSLSKDRKTMTEALRRFDQYAGEEAALSQKEFMRSARLYRSISLLCGVLIVTLFI